MDKADNMKEIRLGKRPIVIYKTSLKDCLVCKKKTQQEFILVTPNIENPTSEAQQNGAILGGFAGGFIGSLIGAGIGAITHNRLSKPSEYVPGKYIFFFANYCTECKNTFLSPITRAPKIKYHEDFMEITLLEK